MGGPVPEDTWFRRVHTSMIVASTARGGSLRGLRRPVGTTASAIGAKGVGAGTMSVAGGVSVAGVPSSVHDVRIAPSRAKKNVSGKGLGTQPAARIPVKGPSTRLRAATNVAGFK